MKPASVKKTDFFPGPGYRLWEVTRIPYAITDATQTCQRGLDSILQICKDCVDNYVDNCIVFPRTWIHTSSILEESLAICQKLALPSVVLSASLGKARLPFLGLSTQLME